LVMNKIFFMTLFFIKRSRLDLGLFPGFQMVRHSNARDRPKSTIRKPEWSGFRRGTVPVYKVEIWNFIFVASF
jgi:hypothetical protein